jgi:tetratricopeptide (TPR) repeat protein
MASSARIEELERKFNENPRRYFAPLANEYRKAGDLTQAISICRTYVPQQPGHMSGQIVFGQALFEAGEFEEAQGVFASALQLDPENLIALRHLGDIARERGEIASAREWYRRVLDADPRNDEIAAQLATLNGLPDAPKRDVAVTGVDGSAPGGLNGWNEINPEKTLELPQALIDSAMRMSAGVPEEPVAPPPPPPPPVVETAPAAPLAPDFDVDLGAFDGFFASEEPVAAEPAAPVETAAHNDLGLEVMEFVPPARTSSVGAAPPAVSHADAADTPSAFVTETMAELYLQQGFHEEALQVYRQLLAQSPNDPNLQGRVAQLESGSRSSVGMAADVSDSIVEAANQRRNAPTVRSVRAFFGGLAAKRVMARAPEHHADDRGIQHPDDRVAEYGGGDDHSVEHHDAPTAVEAKAEVAEETPAVEAAAPETHSIETHSVETHSVETHAVETTVSETPVVAPPVTSTVVEEETSSYSFDEGYGGAAAFGDDSYGADAFSGGLVALGGNSELDPEYGGDGLVSRRAEDVDEFGLPKNTSEPGAFGFGDESELAGPVASSDGSSHGSTGSSTGGSVSGLFPDAQVAAHDEAAASALSGAYSPPGVAARRASTELSLDSVFRESPDASSGGGGGRKESSAFSFDQFFGQESVGGMTSGDGAGGGAGSSDKPVDAAPTESGMGNTTGNGTGGTVDSDPAETEQFSSWLSGLKKK